jgi:hypothetical protein
MTRKKFGIIFIMAIFLLGLTVFFANAETSYTLKSSVSASVNLPHVIEGRQSYAQQHIMWRDPSGNINMINSFGGADVVGNENAYFHYVNAGTGAHALVEGGKCSFGRNSVYDSVHNKFYWYGEYCSNAHGGSFNEFDPVTMTNKVIREGGSEWFSGTNIRMGGDNKIYFTSFNTDYWAGGGGHLYAYDPAVGVSSWTDYGVIFGPCNGIMPGLAIDGQYIYVAWQQYGAPNYWHLMVHPIGSGSWSEVDFGDGQYPIGYDFFFSIENATNKFFAARSVDGRATWKYYYLENGGVRLIGSDRPSEGGQSVMDLNMKNHISMMSVGNYSQFLDAFNFDMNWDYAMPNPSNPTSTVVYGPHDSWHYPDSGFSTSALNYAGPWYDLEVNTLVPNLGPSNFYAIGESIADYNYKNQTSAPVYMKNLPSVYYSLGVPATYSPLHTQEVYFSGYPGQFWRWNPVLSWSTSNPRAITLNQSANYRVFMDYDANGKIWIGSNVCGATAGCIDYGTVSWYDPATEAKGEMFQGVWTGGNPPATGNGIKYTNMAITNNRSKVVVSSNDGKLTVINALANPPSIEGEYALGKKAFMAEVASDRVLGITKDGDTSQIFLFQPSTRTMIIVPQPVGVTGQTFGSADGSIARREFKLEKGPDGYGWLFVDKKIYRVHPETLVFEYIATDTGDSNKMIFAENKRDLILYGQTKPSYIPDLLEGSEIFSSADINQDSFINITDLGILMSDFMKSAANAQNPRSDINSDGNANVVDLGILMSEWKN